LTKDADVDRLIAYIENEHPDLNILINNAGIQYNYDVVSEHDINFKAEHEIKTNFSGPVKLTLSLLPLLRNHKDAAIVNISSALGMVPKRSAPIYCATKAATHIFTKALRYQLTDVKIFEVIPPLVATQMTEGRGIGKISPEQVVREFIIGFKKDRFEISIGKVKFLRLLHRIWPAVAERMLRDR
jgi:short-subunit dehydrogenase involved in D-alanine esterification of teichoic acids